MIVAGTTVVVAVGVAHVSARIEISPRQWWRLLRSVPGPGRWDRLRQRWSGSDKFLCQVFVASGLHFHGREVRCSAYYDRGHRCLEVGFPQDVARSDVPVGT